MKKAGLIGIIILLTGIIAWYLLSSKPSNSVQLVKFKGIESATNFSKGYVDWLSSVADSADQINAIPAQENDLIYFLSGDDGNPSLVMRNQKPSEKVLDIRVDTIGIYLDNRLVSISLGGDNRAAEQWLNDCSKEDIRHLQMVFIADSLTENNLQQLKKIGAFNINIGLVIDTEYPLFAQVEKILNPTWLWMTDGTITSEMVRNWKELDHLETLILMDTNIDQARWDELKSLNRLYLHDLVNVTDAQLRELPKGLSALQISNAKMQNLNFLEGHSKLKELSVNYCDDLTDISSLTNQPHLTSLSFANCDSIPGLKYLDGLKELRWFAPPANISEQELASIVNNNPGLETLVLVGCKHINSLDMLKGNDKLAHLTLVATPVAPGSLTSLDHLKYLSFGEEDKKDSLAVEMLQTKLPHTIVTSAEPFCMGTGWLIVFFGLIILLSRIVLRVKISLRG